MSWRPLAFLALRTVAGVMFAMHGSQRLFGWPAGDRATGWLRLASSAIELATGTLLAAGVAVRASALVAALAMLAGVLLRRTELVALYAVIWSYVAAGCRTPAAAYPDETPPAPAA